MGISDCSERYVKVDGSEWVGLPVEVSAALLDLAAAGMELRQALDNPVARLLPIMERLALLVELSNEMKEQESKFSALVAAHSG